MSLEELPGKWQEMAKDFKITRGDSEVEAAFNGCATELQSALDVLNKQEPNRCIYCGRYQVWLGPPIKEKEGEG